MRILFQHRPLGLVLPALLTVLALAGCAGDDDDDSTPRTRAYRIEILNLTAAQPLSPPALAAHDGTFAGWALGQAASPGLEDLAEGGSPANFLTEAGTSSAVSQTLAGTAPVDPGRSVTLEWELADRDAVRLLVATMLVNTNDAFTGRLAMAAGQLAVGQSASAELPAYDAGTEANSETAATVPGPAAGGTGFEATRDDGDFVTMHPGVVSADDGLTTSALGEVHRFQNPVARLTVTRLR